MNRAQLARYLKDRQAFRENEIVLPSGQRLGEVIEPWQREHVFGPLDATKDRQPLYRLLYLELPRGHAKTATMAAEALTAAFLDGDVRIFMCAADQDQARLCHEALVGYLKRNPEIRPSFHVARNEIRAKATGATIRVLSSDAPTAYGLGGLSSKLLILCDELWAWAGRELWDAMFTATAKVQDWRVIVGSNAGFDTTSVAWEIRELCRTAADERFYLYSPDGVQASWITAKDLATQQRTLPPEVYQRLWENRWVEGSGSLITREQLDACVDSGWRPQRAGSDYVRYVVGVDLGLVRDRTARAVVHKEASGRVVLDDLRTWQGSRREPVQISDVETDLVDVDRRFNHPRFVLDPWQLQSSQQRLRGQLSIGEFRMTAESVRRLSENLLRLIRDRQLRIYPDSDLERELLGLQMVQTGYGWRMDHRSGGFSDRAVALAMAALDAAESPATSADDVKRFAQLNRELAPPARQRAGFASLTGVPGMPDYGGVRRL